MNALTSLSADQTVPDGLIAELRMVRRALEALEAKVMPFEMPTAALNFLPLASRRWVKQVIGEIAHEHGVAPADLTGAARTATIVRPRAILIWVLRRATDWSLPRIGLVVDRDHSSVLHAIRTVDRWRSADSITAEHTDALLARARIAREHLLAAAAAATREGTAQ